MNRTPTATTRIAKAAYATSCERLISGMRRG